MCWRKPRWFLTINEIHPLSASTSAQDFTEVRVVVVVVDISLDKVCGRTDWLTDSFIDPHHWWGRKSNTANNKHPLNSLQELIVYEWDYFPDSVALKLAPLKVCVSSHGEIFLFITSVGLPDLIEPRCVCWTCESASPYTLTYTLALTVYLCISQFCTGNFHIKASALKHSSLRVIKIHSEHVSGEIFPWCNSPSEMESVQGQCIMKRR